jgi:hypothetical protein
MVQHAFESRDEALRQRLVSLQEGFHASTRTRSSRPGGSNSTATRPPGRGPGWRARGGRAARLALRGEVEAKAGRREMTETDQSADRADRDPVAALGGLRAPGEQLMTLVKARSSRRSWTRSRTRLAASRTIASTARTSPRSCSRSPRSWQQRAHSSELKALSDTFGRLVEERASKADLAALSARFRRPPRVRNPCAKGSTASRRRNAMVSAALVQLERNKVATTDLDAKLASATATWAGPSRSASGRARR